MSHGTAQSADRAKASRVQLEGQQHEDVVLHLRADLGVCAYRHGDSKGKVVPLHSTAIWQRGNGVMECKYQGYSGHQRPPCHHQSI